MNGADVLLATLEHHGVEVCFANPGTTEIHVVDALDRSSLRAVTCLFEGVATGAADGYARVSGRTAATLLHLGPGLANGWANLHNARRAGVPVLNVVGEHATFHGVFDPPLESDTSTLVDSLGGWSRRCVAVDSLGEDAAAALGAAYGPPGRVATLLLPADVAWSNVGERTGAFPVAPRQNPRALDDVVIDRAAVDLGRGRGAILLGGSLTREHVLLAHRIAGATSSRVLVDTFPTIMDRGVGVAPAERVPYLSHQARAFFEGLDTLVLVGASAPVAFFAYPGESSIVTPEGCTTHDVARPGTSTLEVLEALADATNSKSQTRIPRREGRTEALASGEITRRALVQIVASTLPEGTIVVDESLTSGASLYDEMGGAADHQWICLTGGSIGFALPAAVGAAIAGGRRVLALESDGSMMYTSQALWTMAREGLDVTVVALANGRYAILEGELSRLGPREPEARSARLLRLDQPALDLAALARAMGVASSRVDSVADLARALEHSYQTPGPTFIEAVLSR